MPATTPATLPEANPYAHFLDQRNPVEILTATPSALATLADSISSARIAHPPAPGKWSPAEILSHLADCEIAFAFRLRQTLAQSPNRFPLEEAHTIQPFDQDRWAAYYPAVNSAEGAAQALATFTALRQWNLLLINAALPTEAGTPVSHPERGPMTFSTIVETMAGHDINHLIQLQKMAHN